MTTRPIFDRQSIDIDRLRISFTPEGWPRVDFAHANGDPAGAAVLPVTADGRIVLVQEKRFMADRQWHLAWNLLRGGRMGFECLDETARREMREESGIDAPLRRFVSLGAWYPDFGFSTSRMQLFAAVLHGVDLPARLAGSDGETVAVQAFSEAVIGRMMRDGELTDLAVPAALYAWNSLCREKGWTFSGTKNVSIHCEERRLEPRDVAAWEQYAKTNPHASFEREAGRIRFSVTWVPLDGYSVVVFPE